MLTKDVNKYVLVSALYCTIKNEYCTFQLTLVLP